MIISFFVFLIISLSILFGLISFIIGFKNELPSSCFNANKNFITYKSSWSTLWEKDDLNGITNGAKPSYFNESTKKDIVTEYMELSDYPKDSNGQYSKEDFDRVYKLNHDITDYGAGSIPDFITLVKSAKDNSPSSQELKQWNNPDDITKMTKVQNALLGTISLKNNVITNDGLFGKANLNDYILYKNVFSKKFGDSIIFDYNEGTSFKYGSQQYDIYMLQNMMPIQKWIIDTAHYQTQKYRNTPNVIFNTGDAQDNAHYKLGQTVKMAIPNGPSQDFVYGGTISASFFYQSNKSIGHNDYYIQNYVPVDKENDFRLIRNTQGVDFAVYPKDFKGDGDKLREWVMNIAGDNTKDGPGFLEGIQKESFEISNHIGIGYIFFSALLSLTVIICVIMFLLDIVIAWFLIKQIIKELSQQLLFLKTIGATNNEIGLLNLSSLVIILGTAFCLSFVGMLGIQALFINLAGSFIQNWLSWSTIQPYSLIAIFGVLILLVGIYYVSSVQLVRKLKTNGNVVIEKSELRFSGIRNWLFSINVNSGLSFSFGVKNFNKIIITFLITLLILTLSFVVLEFRVSIDENHSLVNKTMLNTDTLSSFDSTRYLYNGDNKTTQLATTYDDSQNRPNTEEITIEDLAKQFENPDISTKVTGKYIYRDTIQQVLNYELKNHPNDKRVTTAKNEFDKLCDSYDAMMQIMYGKINYNFSLNFGVVYSKADFTQIAAESYDIDMPQMQADSAKRLIVLSPNDSRYNDIFKDAHSERFDVDNNELPIVTAPKFKSDNANEIVNDAVENADINWHVNNITPSSHGQWSNNWSQQNFKAKIDATYYGIQNNGVMYVKEDVFNSYIEHLKKIMPNYNPLWNEILNYKYKTNSFWGNDIPVVLQQITIGKGNEDDSLQSYLASDDFKNIVNNPTTYAIIEFNKIMNDEFQLLLTPLINTLIAMLVLCIVLLLAFIIFMVMSIMTENDNIIFIMKSLGYKNRSILWKIISGYLIAEVLAIIVGIIISVVLLGVLSDSFTNILYLPLKFYVSGPIIGLIIGVITALGLAIIGISEWRIHVRSLTNREE